ncbi:MAG TPA: hypothetical protein VFT72_19255 [Opitutaceae bacterium]|nr:hypothetical protein [Opitutaceae bacterium]
MNRLFPTEYTERTEGKLDSNFRNSDSEFVSVRSVHPVGKWFYDFVSFV